MARMRAKQINFDSKITYSGTPTINSDQDIPNKLYIDTAVAGLTGGLNWKAQTLVATNANIADLANIAEASLTNFQSQGVNLSEGDRVLVRAQTAAAEDGVYVVGAADSGTGGLGFREFTRAADADTTEELDNAVVAVDDGDFAQIVYMQRAEVTSVDVTSQEWGFLIPVPATDFINQAASVTAFDGDDATATTVGSNPAGDGYFEVSVNGIEVELGESGSEAGGSELDCYFSGDSGTTARDLVDVVAGDTLHWNGPAYAGYELDGSDKITVRYNRV